MLKKLFHIACAAALTAGLLGFSQANAATEPTAIPFDQSISTFLQVEQTSGPVRCYKCNDKHQCVIIRCPE